MKNELLLQGGTRHAQPYRKIVRVLLIAAFLIVALYYLWTRGFLYFRYSRAVYTDYFWYRAPWLLLHVVGGIAATLTGMLQFVPAIRARYPRLHRALGKTYLGSVVIAAGASFYLVSTSQLGLPYAVGLAMLGVVWLSNSLMAWLAIVRGNVAMHREWMIRSYVVTLSFVIFRLVEDLLVKMNISSFVERKVLMAWACWAIPLFFTELILQFRKLN